MWCSLPRVQPGLPLLHLPASELSEQPCTWLSCACHSLGLSETFPAVCHISGLPFVSWNPDLFFPLCGDKPYLPLQSAHKCLNLNPVSFTSAHSYLARRLELLRVEGSLPLEERGRSAEWWQTLCVPPGGQFIREEARSIWCMLLQHKYMAGHKYPHVRN